VSSWRVIGLLKASVRRLFGLLNTNPQDAAGRGLS